MQRIVILLMLFPNALSAGFEGPVVEADLVKVADVENYKDESLVRLHGYIASSAYDNKYVFKDNSGEIPVRIRTKTWGGLKVTPTDKVEIQGEVDKHKRRPTDIEVKQIKIINEKDQP